jgi:SAM-dependent methyltransferase
LRDTWESAAPGWAKWEEKFSAGLDDVTDALLDRADIGPGMRVIDLACGAGSQTLRAARRVGRTGQILAMDISPTMLARRETRKAMPCSKARELGSVAQGSLGTPSGRCKPIAIMSPHRPHAGAAELPLHSAAQQNHASAQI